MNKLCKDNIICCDDNCQRCANLVYAEFIEAKRKLLELQHTNDFDAVKVVRCGECKNGELYIDGTHYVECAYHGLEREDWFCADGKRKDEVSE